MARHHRSRHASKGLLIAGYVACLFCGCIGIFMPIYIAVEFPKSRDHALYMLILGFFASLASYVYYQSQSG